MTPKEKISASILAADFARLGDDVSAVLKAGADSIHFDVMDHHFVPNLSIGADVCKALRQFGITAAIDVHLMVDTPEQYIQPFADAGATRIIFHPETVDHPSRLLQTIRAAGMGAGLAFNPDQPVTLTEQDLPVLDVILVMSVFPGFGGQKFIEKTLSTLKIVRQRLDQLDSNIDLAVDGGIKIDNIATVAHAGANCLVLGTGLFSATHYKQRIQELKHAIKSRVD